MNESMNSLLTNANVDDSEFLPTIIELIDSLATLDNMNSSGGEANSTFEKTDGHSAEVPSISWQDSQRPNADYASTSTWYDNSSSTKANYILTRKRSLDTSAASSAAIEHSGQISSGTENYYTQQSDADEVPAKISAYNPIPVEVASGINKHSENLFMDNKDTRSSCSNVIDQWSAAPSTSGSNQNPYHQNQLSYQSELDESNDWVTNVRNDVHLIPLMSTINNNYTNEEKKINETFEKSMKNEDIRKSIDTKPNIYKKNRIEQLKYILMMKARNNGWSLSGVIDLNDVNHFCDAIHHFEITSRRICALTEVKFFEDSNKTTKINYRSIFSDEFNIQRYFRTFCKFERSCFSNQHSTFTVMTNREIDVDRFDRKNIQVSCENNRYTLKVVAHYEESKIYKKCIECFDLPKLARRLCEFVCYEHRQPYFNMELMKKYHLALVNEKVLQIATDLKHGGRLAKFHPHFVEGIELTNAAKELRYHLVKCLGSLPTDCMSFRIPQQDFGEDVTSSRFPETVQWLPDENARQTFEHFFKVFQIIKITKLSDRAVVAELGKQFLKLDREAYFNAVQQSIYLNLFQSI